MTCNNGIDNISFMCTFLGFNLGEEYLQKKVQFLLQK